MVIDDPLFRRNATPITATRGGKPDKAPPLGPDRRKHPTKATKLDLLRYCASLRAADIRSVADRFDLSYNGAKVKLWRLTKQGILSARLECDGKTKTWWLTKAGERQLGYLENAERVVGGIAGMQLRYALAENGRLKNHIERLQGAVAEASSIVNRNVALDALAEARKEIGRLKAENRVLLEGLRQKRMF